MGSPFAHRLFLLGDYSCGLLPSTSQWEQGRNWAYAGAIGGVTLQVQILQGSSNQFQLKATGSPVNLTGLPNPVTVTMVIGNDLGTTSVNATH